MTLIRSKHGHVPSLIAKMTGVGEKITKPLDFPASLQDFKGGESYAVFIEHPLGNILIQGSGGYVEGALKGYQADVVFLGIARLGKVSSEYQEAYFRESVITVNATRIIPIHWDDFMHPLTETLVPQNRLMDDFEAGMEFIIKKVKDNKKLRLHMLPSFEKIVLFPAA